MIMGMIMIMIMSIVIIIISLLSAGRLAAAPPSAAYRETLRSSIFEVAALAREPLGSTVWAGRVPPSTQTAPRTWPMATSTTRRRRRRTRWRR